jgi:hypothetical protein
MSIMDMDVFSAAFRSHAGGSSKFTRRMVIALADMDGTSPRQTVRRCERLGLLREGSWEWFAANGGISAEQVQQVRAEKAKL